MVSVMMANTKSIRIPGAVAAALLLGACGDDSPRRANFDLSDDDSMFAGAPATLVEGDEFAALTENGAVKLGLTADRVYFELSDVLREHVDSAIHTGMEESDSRVARSIGSAVRRGVSRALEIEVDFGIHEIRDVEYRGGELVFDFVDEGDARTLENIDLDDEPLTRSFAEDDARAFVEAFRRVKGGGGGEGGRAVQSTDGGADTAAGAPDDDGGATF